MEGYEQMLFQAWSHWRHMPIDGSELLVNSSTIIYSCLWINLFYKTVPICTTCFNKKIITKFECSFCVLYHSYNAQPLYPIIMKFNTSNAELKPICHLLVLLGAHHILHVSRVTVKGHFNPLNAQLNPICHLLALLGAHHILHVSRVTVKGHFNPLNAELNPICHLLALLGAHHILHVSRIRVKCNLYILYHSYNTRRNLHNEELNDLFCSVLFTQCNDLFCSVHPILFGRKNWE